MKYWFFIELFALVFFLGCIQEREQLIESEPISEKELAPSESPVEEPSEANELELCLEKRLDSSEFKEQRIQMVESQMRTRDIDSEIVLKAMKSVPRHNFVPEKYRNEAYADHPLPIGHGQTISQPYIVALMTQELGVKKGDRVLEIGTGSGYQAAVLAELTDEVYSIEIIPELAESASKTLKENCYFSVKVKQGDGYFGWEEHAPFDKIIITAAATHIPRPLIDQLKDNGQLIVPLGSTLYHQTLTLISKDNNELKSEYITSVRFVPMTGEIEKHST